MRLAAAIDLYLLQLEADGRSVHTRDQASRHLERFRSWLSATGRANTMAAIDPPTIAAYFVSNDACLRPDGQPKKPTALNALRSSLRTFFCFAHAAGFTPTNPARLLRRARCGPAPPRALGDDDQRRLVETLARADDDAGRRDRALFGLLLGAGLRIGSALALELRDLDLEACEVALRSMKGGREDRLPLAPAVVDLLRGYVAGRKAGPLFAGRSGKPINRRHAHRRLIGWLREAGIARSASPHSLRHSFATKLYGRTGDVAVVQAALAHTSITSTIRYARPTADRVRQALGAREVAT